MTPNYPDVSPQNLIEPWWIEHSDDDFKPGKLIWAFLPHVEQIPYTLEPIGRDEPTEHTTGKVQIKRFEISSPPIKKNLPLAAMPVFKNEMFCAYRTKKRPAIIISKGGTFIEKALTKNKSKWRTDRTVLVVPSYSVRDAFSPEFCERVQRCEYPQFLWDYLPLGGTDKGSIIRFDHLQPVGRSPKSVEFTKYCLSEKAMTFIMEWISWLISGYLDEKSEFCKTRSFFMEL
ncbi:MAG: hypothetical protein KJ737_00495 [Proteobacteria bacterium]|nr:hypothetical protein [Pseudomonadota bacterium]